MVGLHAVPDLAPEPELSPDAAAPCAGVPTDALYRQGISSARRELRAGTARRHRAATAAPASPHVTAPPVTSTGGDELRTQRAGVRAALAELRQHRGTA